MRTLDQNRAVAAVLAIMLAANIVFLSVNGVFVPVAPAVWYEAVPGVTDTGFFYQHFIRDIGMIQLFLGLAFAVGWLRPESRITLWAAATVWLAGHATFMSGRWLSGSARPRRSCATFRP